MFDEITIKTKLIGSVYSSYWMFAYYRKTSGILITICGIILLSIFILNTIESKNFEVAELILPLVFLIGLPFYIFIRSRLMAKNHSSNFGENTYYINQETIQTIGDGHTSTIAWSKMYKVIETNKLFLLYQTKRVAYLIPKHDMEPSDIISLRELALSMPNIKTKLQKI